MFNCKKASVFQRLTVFNCLFQEDKVQLVVKKLVRSKKNTPQKKPNYFYLKKKKKGLELMIKC